VIGTLYLTATHIIFVDPDGKKETWVCSLLMILFTESMHFPYIWFDILSKSS
jgi:hypothetical protein